MSHGKHADGRFRRLSHPNLSICSFSVSFFSSLSLSVSSSASSSVSVLISFSYFGCCFRQVAGRNSMVRTYWDASPSPQADDRPWTVGSVQPWVYIVLGSRPSAVVLVTTPPHFIIQHAFIRGTSARIVSASRASPGVDYPISSCCHAFSSPPDRQCALRPKCLVDSLMDLPSLKLPVGGGIGHGRKGGRFARGKMKYGR